MDLTVGKIPSANSTGAPYIAGNFAPLKTEVTAFDLEVIGRVPEELSGRFLRIGPNPVDEPDLVHLVRYHWFAGTGMAHGLRLRGGKAEWFRSRFVIDRDCAKALSRQPIPGPGEGKRDGNVNTNLMNVSGKLCAVVEGAVYRSNLTTIWKAFDGPILMARSKPGSLATRSSIPSQVSSTRWHMNRFSRSAISRSIATGAPRPRHGSTCRTFRSSTTRRSRSPPSSSPTSL